MSQTSAILSDLQEGRILTPLDALKRHGVFRLAARVNDLREAGFPVQTETVEVNGKRIAAYWLPLKEEQIELGFGA